jgi:signal transduction histidine kinase
VRGGAAACRFSKEVTASNPILRATARGLTLTRQLAERGLALVDPEVSRELSARGLELDGHGNGQRPAHAPEVPEREALPTAEDRERSHAEPSAPATEPPANHVEAQLAVASALATASNIDEALRAVLAAIAEGFGWPEGGCWLPEPDEPEPPPPDDGTVVMPLISEGSTIGVIEFLAPEGITPDGPRPTLDAIASQVAQFVARRRAEAEVERLKDEFFGLVSHELRTPLTSIVGYTEMLDRIDGERLSERGQGFIDVIRRNARREMRLVGDLLVLVRIQAGTFEIEPDTVDLRSVAEQSVEAARPAAVRAGLELALEATRVKPCAGDAERLAQAFDNLLTNAIKFTPEGGRVDVRMRADDLTAVIEVSDTGVGIPAKDHDRLFDRLYRASSATEEHVPGTGLGLTIVKAIVEAHEGTIEVESSEHRGSTFRVELPLRALDPSGSQGNGALGR